MRTDVWQWSAAPAQAGAALRRRMRRIRDGVRARRERYLGALAAQHEPAHPELYRIVTMPSRGRRMVAAGVALTLVGVLLTGLVLQAVVFSLLRYERDQAALYQSFRYQLADATAPVGQVDAEGRLTPIGAPVALLRVPDLGIDEVVVEGTSSGATVSAPGHRRDTAMAGQRGVAVIMARRATYGGPFSRLGELEPGDRIITITGQGESAYRVTGVRQEGDPQPVDLGPRGGRLTLVTAAGFPYLPTGVMRIDAELVSEPFATPSRVLRVGSLGPEESALVGDEAGWLPLLLLLELTVIAVAVAVLAVRRWGRWHTWIVATPVLLWLGFALGEQIFILLPNIL